MTGVYKITEEQAEFLKIQFYDFGSMFGPRFHNGIWFVSQEEVNNNRNVNIPWLNDLELIEIDLTEDTES
jgi:hypothetical protein